MMDTDRLEAFSDGDFQEFARTLLASNGNIANPALLRTFLRSTRPAFLHGSQLGIVPWGRPPQTGRQSQPSHPQMKERAHEGSVSFQRSKPLLVKNGRPQIPRWSSCELSSLTAPGRSARWIHDNRSTSAE
jgi:hypothetical protein